MQVRRLAQIFCVAAAACVTPTALACSACGCTLSTDWASQGLAAGGGWRADVRFDYFDQTQLRSGADSISRASLELPNDREIQQYTINRNYTFALDYSPNKAWGLSVSLPWYDRAHATIAEGDAEISTSQSEGIGDLRFLARYTGLAAQRQAGIEFGIKLPTGRFTQDFRTGPQAGQLLDRGLQLGSGTADLLFGAFRFGALSPDWGYSVQALLTEPLDSRDHFRPGFGANLNAGLRYTANSSFVPQLQLNARFEKRESGTNGDVENSGASLIYLSPGVTWNLSRRFSAYAFFQVPLYQHVNGLQLEATRFASVGLHYVL